MSRRTLTLHYAADTRAQCSSPSSQALTMYGRINSSGVAISSEWSLNSKRLRNPAQTCRVRSPDGPIRNGPLRITVAMRTSRPVRILTQWRSTHSPTVGTAGACCTYPTDSNDFEGLAKLRQFSSVQQQSRYMRTIFVCPSLAGRPWYPGLSNLARNRSTLRCNSSFRTPLWSRRFRRD